MKCKNNSIHLKEWNDTILERYIDISNNVVRNEVLKQIKYLKRNDEKRKDVNDSQ